MSTTSTPEHLIVKTSDRGFDHLPPIPSDYGGWVRVYESSAAEGAHIWLRCNCPEDLNRRDGVDIEAVAHLPIEQAKHLRDQLNYLIEQAGEPRDEVWPLHVEVYVEGQGHRVYGQTAAVGQVVTPATPEAAPNPEEARRFIDAAAGAATPEDPQP